MNDKINDPIVIPHTSISITVPETVSKILQAMFNSKIGSLELNVDRDGFNGPQLIISCYLSKEVNDKWNSLKQMYTVEQLWRHRQESF
ncbi:MAG: hypothetical protein GYA02_05590 [Clostridiaceae bacterium]|nr:hypothetical protein [Clostridiaceae bacterium]